jgi:uncharacterized membrane protein HdeD (DUF308 family)
MHHIMAKFWWILAVRGIFGMMLGLLAFAVLISLECQSQGPFGTTAATVLILIILLGLYAFWDGLFSIVLGVQDFGDGRRWWALILEGVLTMGLGLLAWIMPGKAILVLLYWIAAWALGTGLLEILQGLDLNEYKERRRPLFWAGFCSMIFGFLVLAELSAGVTLIWLIGGYSLSFGLCLLVLAFRLRHFAQTRRV